MDCIFQLFRKVENLCKNKKVSKKLKNNLQSYSFNGNINSVKKVKS